MIFPAETQRRRDKRRERIRMSSLRKPTVERPSRLPCPHSWGHSSRFPVTFHLGPRPWHWTLLLSLRLCVSAGKRIFVLLQIQALLPDLIDLALGAQCQFGDGQTQIAQAACLREYRIRLAIHLL